MEYQTEPAALGEFEDDLENAGPETEEAAVQETVQGLVARPWRVAAALNELLEQINLLAPLRSKVSDGSIGDAAHATRSSDHNPWVVSNGQGIVTARDFTHDPLHGADMAVIAEALRRSKDRRIKYIIFAGRIADYRPEFGAWEWRPYTGTNGHFHHMHVSVRSEPALFDSTTPFSLAGLAPKPAESTSEGEWDELASKEEVRALVREELQNAIGVIQSGDNNRIYKASEHERNATLRVLAAVEELSAKVDALSPAAPAKASK